MEWINRTLKVEHIVVRTLEEDLYDGLVLHHLLRKNHVKATALLTCTLLGEAHILKMNISPQKLKHAKNVLTLSLSKKWVTLFLHKNRFGEI